MTPSTLEQRDQWREQLKDELALLAGEKRQAKPAKAPVIVAGPRPAHPSEDEVLAALRRTGVHSEPIPNHVKWPAGSIRKRLKRIAESNGLTVAVSRDGDTMTATLITESAVAQ